jgi:DNA-binding MarR family transcriptional regulator
MRKRDLVRQVVLGGREHNIGAVLFHQAVGRNLGVNVTDMKCLDIISLRSSVRPSQLAAWTGLSTGATTALIDRLEKRQLVARRPNPQDRRGTIIVLTKYAVRALPALFQSLAEAMEKLASSYTEDDLAVLADFFSKTARVWEAERAKVQLAGRRTASIVGRSKER